MKEEGGVVRDEMCLVVVEEAWPGDGPYLEAGGTEGRWYISNVITII